MAHHKRKRAKHQRAGCLLCKPHKDDRDANGFNAQTRQEQRQRVDQLDWDRVGAIEIAFGWGEARDTRCAHCKGEICKYENCDEHTEDYELSDGRWVCSWVCWNAVVGP